MTTADVDRQAIKRRRLQRLRRYGTVARAGARALSSGLPDRAPDFVVIGAQRAGTTSLFRYLAEHPRITPPYTKEVQYFSVYHHLGLRWYLGNFRPRVPGTLAFEASPYYLLHRQAPIRMSRELPAAKLVVLLRDPVERAISNYKHNRALGLERRNFADAVHCELDLIVQHGLYAARTNHDLDRRHASYLARGHYAPQLRHWLSFFDRERFFIRSSEALYGEPARIFSELEDFLGLPHHDGISFEVHNSWDIEVGEQFTPQIRELLREHFTSANRELAHLLGWADAWGVPADA